MTAYLLLSVAVLVPVCGLALVVLGRARVLAPAAAGLGVLLALTAVFDNAIVGAGIVGYDEDRILGIRLGVAPVEDFSYAIAAALALPALWTALGTALGARGRRREAA